MLQYHITRPIRCVLYQALPLSLALILLFPVSVQAASTTSSTSGQMDAPAFFRFLMISLLNLAIVFWAGAQLFHSFVLQLSDDADLPAQQAIDQQAAHRFQRIFSASTLLLILLSNVGLLLGQTLMHADASLDQAFSQAGGLLSQNNFGVYWLAREILALLALALTLVLFRTRPRSRVVDELVSWVHLLIALGLLITLALASDAASVASNIQLYAVLLDWLHLLAAALWIGGICYLALIYLPILHTLPLAERTSALLTTLSHFFPLALAGMIMMALSGPFEAAVQMQSFNQLITTAYGRTLLVKALFVVVLLLTTVSNAFFLRPQLARTYKCYTTPVTDEPPADHTTDGPRSDSASAHPSSPSIKRLEAQLTAQERRVTSILRWEPLLGVAVLLCASLLSVFIGGLQSAPASSQPQQATSNVFNATIKTADNLYMLKVSITPYHFGNNTFTVSVVDSKGAPATNIGVVLHLTMLDMDMGTDTVNLQSGSNQGQFTGEDSFSMAGNWQLRLQVRTPDNALHEAKVTLTVPF